MSKVALRTLKLKKYPHGRYKFKALLKRSAQSIHWSQSNSPEIEDLRHLLKRSACGEHLFIFADNHRKKRVYTELYFTNAMDLALAKLTHHDKLHKIYKIIVEE